MTSPSQGTSFTQYLFSYGRKSGWNTALKKERPSIKKAEMITPDIYAAGCIYTDLSQGLLHLTLITLQLGILSPFSSWENWPLDRLGRAQPLGNLEARQGLKRWLQTPKSLFFFFTVTAQCKIWAGDRGLRDWESFLTSPQAISIKQGHRPAGCIVQASKTNGHCLAWRTTGLDSRNHMWESQLCSPRGRIKASWMSNRGT